MKWLLLLLLVVVCSFTVSPSLFSQEISREAPGLFSTRMLEDTVPMVAAKKLMIRSAATLQGTIRIRAGGDDTVVLSYRKKAKADTRSQAIDYIDVIAVDAARSPQGVKVELRAPNPAPWPGNNAGLIEAELVVPNNCVVEIDALYFNLTAEGPFEAVLVPSSLGQLDVRNVTERLTVTSANRKVTLENVKGAVSARTSNSLLTGQEIGSTAHQAHFENEGGPIEINGLVGDVNIRNSFGRIQLLKFEPGGGQTMIRGASGPILVELTRLNDGQVIVSNEFEDVEIELPRNSSARLSLAVDEGARIEVTGLPVRTDLVQSNRLNLVVGDGKALLSVSATGKGNVYIRAKEKGE
ncbi:MAG TPA: hypothetical protein VN285_13200 [Candidatus Deferrimicrobium sp.]|nr:hypothetical protein [Candidatus Deferrimicrobium sp.]